MTVEILRMSGLDAAEAKQAAGTLLDLNTGPRDLRRLLVLDDTALVVQHAPAYLLLDTAARVQDMLCVAVGPRPENARVLLLPGNLGGTQGSPVLWVSDPSGIDTRAAAAAVALGHPPGKLSGLDLLVELLSVEEMFTRVHRAVTEKIPGRVASPGLRLAGADDEAATFAAALTTAVGRLCDPGQGVDGPFPALLPAQIGGASLAEGGQLAGYHTEVTESAAAASEALQKLTGFGGRFRRGDGGAQTHQVEAGAALTDLRDLAVRLLQEASTVGELSANQRRLISDAGVRFTPGSPSPSPAPAAGAGEGSPVYRTVADAIRGGDTLALVTRRLTLTERELKRFGSASYLQAVDERCPPELLARLSDPSQRIHRRGAEGVRGELALADAARAAADALEELVLYVANREWSPAVAFPGDVARVRVALDGVCSALNSQAAAASGAGGTSRAARLARLGDSLTPVLRDLVLRVLAGEGARPSTSGQEAFDTAKKRAVSLLEDWILHVQDKGISSRPPFATADVHDPAPYADEDDVAEIRETLQYPPRDEMWQLCSPADLSVLHLAADPEVVRFASRLSRKALAGRLPGAQPVWTSSGSYAGVLRLVPLRTGFASSNWSETSSVPDPSGAEPS